MKQVLPTYHAVYKLLAVFHNLGYGLWLILRFAVIYGWYFHSTRLYPDLTDE